MDKIYAVLTNLVKNAIKFTQTGSIELGYHVKGEFLEFYVKDTGPGISEEHMKIIFERFRQGSESLNRNYEGSGLGLAISKAYVEILGGRIWVESKIGQGTTMRFTIPYLKGVEMDEPHQNDTKAEVTLISNLKILVVEDDETSQMLFNNMIKPFADNYFHAVNGLEAVKICRNNPGINLVLMDIIMPKMNGYETTRKIREFNKEIIIIAQSAYVLPGVREKAMEAGCNNYISKPIDRVALISLINQYLS
jgi:CheY-like chemotaxis protein